MTPRQGVRDDVHLGHNVRAGRILGHFRNTSPAPAHTGSRKSLGFSDALTRAWPPEPGLRLAESQRLAAVILGALLVLLVGVAVACLRGAS